MPMGNGVTPALLERTGLFRGIGEDALSAAATAASRLALKNGAHLLKQGDPSGHLFLIERGRIKMSVVTPEGTQLTLRYMESGDIIGCAAVFQGMPYPASGMAVGNASVLCWSASQINGLIAQYPKLAANALAIVSGRAEEFLQRLKETVTEKVEQRVARALMRIPTHAGDIIGTSGIKTVTVWRQQLAELANTSLYTVSRIVSGWSRQGIVKAGRGRITICDPRRLADLAGDIRAAKRDIRGGLIRPKT
jgi:CRP/FNR family transcriptional regulator, nitrogen oxide reductase regulator